MIDNLDDMIAKLNEIRAQIGKNIKLNVSVQQELEFGSYHEDRNGVMIEVVANSTPFVEMKVA